MQKTSIELVPHNEQQLLYEIQGLEDINFDTINIPHLKPRGEKQFLPPEEVNDIWNMQSLTHRLVTHLRSQDSISLQAGIDRIQNLYKQGVDDVLLVTGDQFGNTQDIITTSDILDILPNDITVSVAFDLYQSGYGNFHDKIPYLSGHISANIFTQPLFDSQSWGDILQLQSHIPQTPENIYIGYTLIETQKSRDYWKKINSIPGKYLPEGEHNTTIKANSFAITRDRIKEGRDLGYSEYIMMIQTDIDDIIKLFNAVENLSEI